jgi:hypothetical protein
MHEYREDAWTSQARQDAPEFPTADIGTTDTAQFGLQTTDCIKTAFGDKASCDYRLWKTLDETTWVPTTVVFQAITAWLARGSSKVGWIVYYTRDADGNHVTGHLLQTRESGRTWSGLPDLPYSLLGAVVGYGFHPVNATDIWLVAGDAGAGIFGGKTILVSRDGGQTWSLRANTAMDGSNRVGNICSGCGYMSSFTPVSAWKAFMGLGRGGLLGTKDGGRTWYEAIPLEIVNPADGMAGPAYFIDPLHGWVISQAGLFRTTDGGDTWTTGSAPGLPGLPGLVVTPSPPLPTPGRSPTLHSYPGPPGATATPATYP